MCIGIYTHYAHCDQAYLAVRLAELLRSLGIAFDIYSDNAPGKLGLSFDNSVKYRGATKFTHWAQGKSAIVWTHVPSVEQIAYARRYGARVIIAPMWQELVPPFKKVLKRADTVVSLTTAAQELFTGVYRLPNTTLVPFDAGLPITRKDTPVNDRRVRLLLPWFDRNARCSHSDFLGVLSFLIERMPEAHLTVGVNSSRFGPAAARFFQRLGARTEQRVRLVRRTPVMKRIALFQAADLTVWPAECDNYGYCALTSLSAGTPVLSFGVAPHSEYVHHGVNGFLVKTKVDYDDNGVPHAAPDYSLFSAALQTLIAEPVHITALQKKVSINLTARRAAFERGWQTLLST